MGINNKNSPLRGSDLVGRSNDAVMAGAGQRQRETSDLFLVICFLNRQSGRIVFGLWPRPDPTVTIARIAAFPVVAIVVLIADVALLAVIFRHADC